MIYIIGVNHEFQFISQKYPDNGERLRAFLEKTIKEQSPTAIIEEFNEDARSHWNATEVIAESIAKKHELPHIFCEPTQKERDANGILGELGVLKKHFGLLIPRESKWGKEVKDDIAQDFAKREEFWFTASADHIKGNPIMICGTNHLDSYTALLKRKGYESTVIAKYSTQNP